jgi:hypothetical protein
VSRADPHVITSVRSHDRSAVPPPSRARNARDPARRPGVETPILASKITVPGVPGWTVPRPRITKLIAEGTRWCPLTVVTAPPRGQDDGPGAVGGGGSRAGGLGAPGRLRQPAGGLLGLRRRGATPVRHGRPEGAVGRRAGAARSASSPARCCAYPNAPSKPAAHPPPATPESNASGRRGTPADQSSPVAHPAAYTYRRAHKQVRGDPAHARRPRRHDPLVER